METTYLFDTLNSGVDLSLKCRLMNNLLHNILKEYGGKTTEISDRYGDGVNGKFTCRVRTYEIPNEFQIRYSSTYYQKSPVFGSVTYTVLSECKGSKAVKRFHRAARKLEMGLEKIVEKIL